MESEERGTENDEEVSWSCWFRTMLTGAGACILLMFIGVNESFSAVMLPQLEGPDSEIPVTADEESWIASLGIIMAPFASIIIGSFLDAFGRKKGLLLFYCIMCVGFAMISFAGNVYFIYIGRFICGIGAGQYVCGVVYMVEICTEKQREYIFATTAGIFSGGVTLASIIGGYLPWRTATLIFSVTSFVLLITQCFVPESPPWLFKKGRQDAAVRSFQKLGRNESNIRKELETLKLTSKTNTEKLDWHTFLEPTVWKPFVVMVTFNFLQSGSGIFELLFYSVDFITRLGTTFDSLEVAVILSAIRFIVSSTVTIVFRTVIGRKTATVFSAVGMCVGSVTVGVYEYMLRDVNISDRPYQLIPVVMLMVYMVSSVVGLLTLPWLMSSELFPLRVRGTMTGASHLAAYGFMFISLKMYYVCLDNLQIYGLLFLFAGFSFIAVFFGIFMLPETRNKSLFEIEQGFMPKNKRQVEAAAAVQNSTMTLETVVDQ